jgi:hypothetical protein
MSALEEFAKEEKSQSNRVAWREKTSENEKLWEEAVTGIAKGYSVSTVARWLIKEKSCPLSIHTLRHQLKEALDERS